MNGQSFGENVNNSDIFVKSVQLTDGVVVDTPSYPDRIHGDVIEEGQFHEMTVPAVTPAVDRVDAPVEVTPPLVEVARTASSLSAPLLDHAVSENFRERWNEIQGNFVDEPRSAVQQADALVTDVVTQIMQMFAQEHGSLEAQWKQGNDVSTEDLRKSLQRYRAFFNRLVV